MTKCRINYIIYSSDKESDDEIDLHRSMILLRSTPFDRISY